MDRFNWARRPAGLPLVLCATLALSAPLARANLELYAGQDAMFSDNARKTASNETSDVESRTFIRGSYQSDPGKCMASFTGLLGYSTWLDDAFGSETDANMDLASLCELAQGLSWSLDNNLRDVTRDTTASDTPDNTTRKNLFSTGPNYVLRLGPVDSLVFNGRYENTEYDEPEETDSERYVGSTGWNHAFSQALTAGLSSSFSQTEFDTGAEVEVVSLRTTFSKRWATAQLSGSLGVSEIETTFGNGSQKSDGLVGEMDLSRELNPSTNWYLRAARELTDRSSSFDIRFEDFEFNLNDSISVETTTLATGLSKRFSDQSTLNLEIYANQSDLLETNDTEESTGFEIGYTRPLAERLDGSARLGYEYSAFEQDQSDDQQARFELGLDYEATRDLSIRGRLGHERKTSDVPSREYDENWITLGVEYRLW